MHDTIHNSAFRAAYLATQEQPGALQAAGDLAARFALYIGAERATKWLPISSAAHLPAADKAKLAQHYGPITAGMLSAYHSALAAACKFQARGTP